MNIRLKMKMLEAGMKQVEVAIKADITEGYMSKIVNGHYQPSAELAHRIAEVLGTSVGEIFE